MLHAEDLLRRPIKEIDLQRREDNRIGQRKKPGHMHLQLRLQVMQQQALELRWPFRVVLNWGNWAVPLYTHISQALATGLSIGEGTACGRAILCGWGKGPRETQLQAVSWYSQQLVLDKPMGWGSESSTIESTKAHHLKVLPTCFLQRSCSRSLVGKPHVFWMT